MKSFPITKNNEPEKKLINVVGNRFIEQIKVCHLKPKLRNAIFNQLFKYIAFKMILQ